MKRLLFWGITLSIPIVIVEGAVRVRFAWQLGPSVLFYGTSLNREEVNGDADTHSMNYRGEYIKYHPHQKRFTHDKVSGRLIRCTINSRGFRGHDFQTEKAPGVIRVVTLGASSTFGFSDRDDETYPYYLEQILNATAPRGQRFEVINLGIPHLRSEQILALFEAEALPLNPDVVTYYEGINDCWRSRVRAERVKAPRRVVREKLRRFTPLRRGFRWLRRHSIAVFVVDELIKRRKEVTFAEGDLEHHMIGKSENYLANLSAILHECRERHIEFIVATQQAKSYLVDRTQIRGVTYEQECELIRKELALSGKINHWELYFLTHSELMNDLREWTHDNGVPCVDIIKALDDRRDCLLSWVHLNSEGNRIVASRFADEILTDIAHN